jgi:peptidyl-prolyl cis-trans isomerase A (cyclophilin A)
MPGIVAAFALLATGSPGVAVTHGFAGAATAKRPAAARGGSPVDVAMTTSLGTIVVRLEPAKAPITTKNFLKYVDAKAYDDTEFYRTVSKKNEPAAPFEVIQGGLNPKAGNTNAPIALEPTSKTHLSNTDGAIAMARTNDPNSATTEFFLDLGDARYLNAGGPLGAGYAVFGHVIRGIEIVRKIHDAASQGEQLLPAVRILTMRRISS